MAKIDEAASKWERHTTAAADRWKKAVTGKEHDFCKGIEEFTGLPCNPEVMEEYRRGVDATSAEEFRRSVTGKSTEWKEGYIRRMTVGG